MREIKFRGQDDQRHWHYGSLVIYNDGTFAIAENDPTWTDDGYHNDDFDLIKVRQETVGESTGLLDKNGKEVYEGDIIHLKAKNVDKDFGVVTWHKDGYFYVDDGFGEFPRDRCKPIGDFVEDISRDFGAEIYVDGNIHERPQVIEQKKEKIYSDLITRD